MERIINIQLNSPIEAKIGVSCVKKMRILCMRFLACPERGLIDRVYKRVKIGNKSQIFLHVDFASFRFKSKIR
jgi:hypothetical protein